MEQLDYKNIHLAIIAIEKGAKLMKVPPQNMYMRLKNKDLYTIFFCHIMTNYTPKVQNGWQKQRLKH